MRISIMLLSIFVLVSTTVSAQSVGDSAWLLSGNTISGSNFIGTKNNRSLRFLTNDAVRMYMDSVNGAVGIGTLLPKGVLHVGNGSTSTWTYFQNNVNGNLPDAGTSSGLAIGWNRSGGYGESVISFGTSVGSGPYLAFTSWDGTNYNERMKIDSNGLVTMNKGLNINGPAAIGTTLKISRSDAGGVPNSLAASILFNTNNRIIITDFAGGTAGLEVSGVGRYHGGGDNFNFPGYGQIYTLGNLGIGVNSPQYNLDLSGSFRFANGSHGVGKVLTSDANGLVSWQTPASSGLWTDAGSGNLYNTTLTGNVGIGTATPTARLDVNGSVNIKGEAIIGIPSYGAAHEHTINYSHNGTSATALKIVDHSTGSVIRLHSFFNTLYVTRNEGSPGAIVTGAILNPADGSSLTLGPGRWQIESGSFSVNRAWTGQGQMEMTVSSESLKGMIVRAAASQTANLHEWQNSSGTVMTVVDNEGRIGIGATTIPATYKLAVAGNIIAEKIRIKLQSGWPDYVFSPNYKLPSLKEVEKFIKENNHLPGVPSAADVEKNGIDLGDNQAILLKKIEELTLHVIALDKKVEKLAAENEELKKKKNK